jgi:hypothetical protein
MAMANNADSIPPRIGRALRGFATTRGAPHSGGRSGEPRCGGSRKGARPRRQEHHALERQTQTPAIKSIVAFLKLALEGREREREREIERERERCVREREREREDRTCVQRECNKSCSVTSSV